MARPPCPACKQPVSVSLGSASRTCPNCGTTLMYVARDVPGGRWLVADEAHGDLMTPTEAAEYLDDLPRGGSTDPQGMSRIVEAYMVLQGRSDEDIARAKRLVLGQPDAD